VTTKPDDRPTDPRWREVTFVRSVLGIAAGGLSLFRPDLAPLVLGSALIVASVLELAIVPAPPDPDVAGVWHEGRRVRISAGIGLGLALVIAWFGRSEFEGGLIAIGLAVVAVVDGWGAFKAPTPGLRGVRAIRAALALAVALVLLTIPGVVLNIAILLASVAWITVGSVALVGLYQHHTEHMRGQETTVGVADVIGRWLRRRDIGQEHRDAILDVYDYDPADTDRLGRFTILLVLASIIASAGLISDSVASIIGAMIIAPLMGPIVGIAVGIVTGHPARMIRCLIVAAFGTVLTVLIGVVMGSWVGPSIGVVGNNEILARTSPAILDLIVALAAGAAGAYAASNAKVADSLPGVAIAIALVPPLGTAGILLSYGEWELAAGALLLFTTNFVSIVLAASFVFVLVGVVPINQLIRNAERTRGLFATFAVAGILLLIPLTIGGRQAIIAASQTQVATQAVTDWLAPVPGFEIVDISVTSGRVDVSVAGPGDPPDPVALQADLDTALGMPVELELRVIPTVVYSSVPSPTPQPETSASPAP
jgi:uncharacterized hydrophobic protein (TIGR00271 family)